MDNIWLFPMCLIGGVISAILYWRLHAQRLVFLSIKKEDLEAARGEIWMTLLIILVWAPALALIMGLIAIWPLVLFSEWLNEKTEGALSWVPDTIIRIIRKELE